MQIMYDAGCSPEMYKEQGKGYYYPDMTKELCPQEGCKADYLNKHGYYERYVITPGFEGTILIRRYYCKVCKRTVSLLPSFCHPKRTYGTEAIIIILNEFYNKMLMVCLTVLNIFEATKIECSRQLLLHYRRRIERNLNSLIMAITEIYEFKSPPVNEKTEIKKKVRQFLSHIHSPVNDSLKIFKQTRTTYLTPQAI